MLKTIFLSLFVATMASATTISIDDFSQDQGPGALSGSGSSSASISPNLMRGLALTSLAGNLAPVDHSLSVAAGLLNITNGILDNSTVNVTYTLGSSLTPSGVYNVKLGLWIVGSDGNPTSVTVGGTAGISGSATIAPNTVGQQLYFNAPNQVGPGTIELTFNGAPGYDLAVDDLTLVYEVPEPGTFVLIGAALTALAVARKR